jgi:hypothetical protein
MFSTTPSLIEMSIVTVVEMLPMFPSERVSVMRIGDCGASVTSGGKTDRMSWISSKGGRKEDQWWLSSQGRSSILSISMIDSSEGKIWEM